MTRVAPVLYLPVFQSEVAETPGGEEEAAVRLVLQGPVDVVQGGLPLAPLEEIFRLTDEDVPLRYGGNTRWSG